MYLWGRGLSHLSHIWSLFKMTVHGLKWTLWLSDVNGQSSPFYGFLLYKHSSHHKWYPLTIIHATLNGMVTLVLHEVILIVPSHLIARSASILYNFSPKNFKRNVFTPLIIGLLFGPYSMLTFEKYNAEERNWTLARSKFMLGSSTLYYNSRIHFKAGGIAQSDTFKKRTHKRTKKNFQAPC